LVSPPLSVSRAEERWRREGGSITNSFTVSLLDEIPELQTGLSLTEPISQSRPKPNFCAASAGFVGWQSIGQTIKPKNQKPTKMLREDAERTMHLDYQGQRKTEC
jgi:hypothetical protein